MLNWSDIHTVLLDMDGTLLDLHFDNHFWMEHAPKALAKKHDISLQQAKENLKIQNDAVYGQLEWYCLDYWQQELDLPIVELKREICHLIQLRDDTIPFLDALKAAGKEVILVTNAHPDSLSLKVEMTQLDSHIDQLISCHQYGVSKESQSLWQQLQQDVGFDNKHTLFVDDSKPVLESAKKFGIQHLLAVANPDSKRQAKIIEGYTNTTDFRHLLAYIK
ncbi:hydrolase [Psychrosphaera saromensis]|uniref:HAD family hydrolase n=1 Tax=Psychrosphaera saromensis TaxID=716813 RepID=A0A2S7UT58_9GAMM|nr:GMP/IMP nucleotidase [Psychrosphaera saromensis]PQJ52929.1 HAD family hydrolase [Psychrosphaera saromensis]GHB77825.1 hydrolase [Psychrosphaera saromensis]GLQ12915.1 hydrolase [Psychrosphaera saromensis]